MITDAYNLAEVFAAALCGAFAGGVGVFLATIAVRNDAAADRAAASADLAKANAARVATDSARQLGTLHPAYATHTAEWRMVDEPAAEPERCHGCGHPIGQHSGPGVLADRHRCWVVECDCKLSGAQARAAAAPQPDQAEPPVADLATARDCDGYMWQEQGGEELGMWRVLDDGESVGEAIELDTLEHEHGPVTIIYPDGSEGSAADLIDRPEPDAPTETACCTGHGDEPCAPDSGLVPPYCCGDCPDQRPGTDLVPVDAVLVDEPPVTADDLAPIGPDRMPDLPWWAYALIAAALVALTPLLALVAIAALVWWGWDLAEQRRTVAEGGSVVMELEHPAPARRVRYEAQHRAGR